MTEQGRAFEDGVDGRLRTVERTRNTVRRRMHTLDQLDDLVAAGTAAGARGPYRQAALLHVQYRGLRRPAAG